MIHRQTCHVPSTRALLGATRPWGLAAGTRPGFPMPRFQSLLCHPLAKSPLLSSLLSRPPRTHVKLQVTTALPLSSAAVLNDLLCDKLRTAVGTQ